MLYITLSFFSCSPLSLFCPSRFFCPRFFFFCCCCCSLRPKDAQLRWRRRWRRPPPSREIVFRASGFSAHQRVNEGFPRHTHSRRRRRDVGNPNVSTCVDMGGFDDVITLPPVFFLSTRISHLNTKIFEGGGRPPSSLLTKSIRSFLVHVTKKKRREKFYL